MLADTEEENMEEEKEKEEGSTVRPVVLPNGVVVQYGGAGRKHKAGGSVSEGFKATTGYNNKTPRLRFIKEDRRSLTSRITSSSAKSGVFSELIKKVDEDALLSGNDRKECIRTPQHLQHLHRNPQVVQPLGTGDPCNVAGEPLHLDTLILASCRHSAGLQRSPCCGHELLLGQKTPPLGPGNNGDLGEIAVGPRAASLSMCRFMLW